MNETVLGIRRPKTSQDVNVQFANAILDLIASERLVTGNNVLTSRGPGGTSVQVLPPIIPRRSGNFRVQYADETGHVQVRPGIFNEIVPTIGGARLDAEIPPQLEVTGNGVVYIHAAIENGVAVSAEVKFAEGEIPPSNDTECNTTLATITQYQAETDTLPPTFEINPMVSWSLGHQLCGSQHLIWGK